MEGPTGTLKYRQGTCSTSLIANKVIVIILIEFLYFSKRGNQGAKYSEQNWTGPASLVKSQSYLIVEIGPIGWSRFVALTWAGLVQSSLPSNRIYMAL